MCVTEQLAVLGVALQSSMDCGQASVGVAGECLRLGSGHREGDGRRVGERAVLAFAVGAAAALR